MANQLSRLGREPVFNLPSSILLTISILVGIHAVRVYGLSEAAGLELLFGGAVVPVRWTAVYGGASPEAIVSHLSRDTGPVGQTVLVELARYVLDEEGGKPWTALTHALLHGSWAHVLINSVWIAAFATPIVRRCGIIRFLILAAASAVSGAVAFTLFNPYQPLPLVGASGAISGLMGATAWFLFAPPVWLLEGRLAEAHERPREVLADLLRNGRTLMFLLVWFVANYLFAVMAQPLGMTDASIAWEAHLGGFVVGFILFPLLDPLKPRPRRTLETGKF